MLDELQIHQVPVLFGGGRRLFDVLPEWIELEIVRAIDTPEATHIRCALARSLRAAGRVPLHDEKEEDCCHCASWRPTSDVQSRRSRAAGPGYVTADR